MAQSEGQAIDSALILLKQIAHLCPVGSIQSSSSSQVNIKIFEKYLWFILLHYMHFKSEHEPEASWLFFSFHINVWIPSGAVL